MDAGLSFIADALLPGTLRQMSGPTIADVTLRERAMRDVKAKDGSVTVLIGTRDSGKTNLISRIAQFFHRPTYCVFPEQMPPSWATRISLSDALNPHIVPPHSTVAFDDMPVTAGNRSYNDALVQTLERLIPMVRHERKLHLIFSTQSTAQADRYILDADMAFLKPLGILMADVERPFISRIYRKEVDPLFNGKTDWWVRRHAYMYSRLWKGLITVAKA